MSPDIVMFVLYHLSSERRFIYKVGIRPVVRCNQVKFGRKGLRCTCVAEGFVAIRKSGQNGVSLARLVNGRFEKRAGFEKVIRR